MNRKRFFAGAAALAAVTLTLGLGMPASATVVGASASSNFVAIPVTRVVNTPGIALTTVHQVVTVQVAGVDGIPADITAVSGRLVLWNTAKGGQSMNIWDGVSGQPGTLTVSTLSPTTGANAGSGASSAFQIGLHNGKVSVGDLGGSGHFLLEVSGYFEPATAGAVGPQGPKGDTGVQGPKGDKGDKGDPGTPGTNAGPLTTTGVTTVSNRDDSGDHGNWAVDSFNRTLSVTRHAEVPVSNCGTTSGDCWFYTGTISDTGQFMTADGANSPSAGTAIHGTVAGQFNGGEGVEFYASTDTAVQPPATVSGGTPSTTDWVKQDFAAGTHFSSVTTKDGWSWTYTAPNTCEQWVDASSGQTGDITGVNACS